MRLIIYTSCFSGQSISPISNASYNVHNPIGIDTRSVSPNLNCNKKVVEFQMKIQCRVDVCQEDLLQYIIKD